MDKIKIGKIGEMYAEKFLVSRGHRTVRMNFYSKYGEIDLITINPNNELVFTEVKTRTTSNFGEPQDAITYSKRTKLIKTALHFLNSSSQNSSSGWRIDLIAVKLDKHAKLKEINHLKNIFNG